MAIRVDKLNSVSDSLKKYDYLTDNDSDFIEVSEWANGEGWNVTISRSSEGEQSFHLTEGALDAINYLIKYLRFEVNTTCKDKD